MAKEYKVGEKYYLPVTVERIFEGEFGVTLSYTDGDEGDTALIWNAPDLLLTATEIAENVAGRRCAECYPTYEELKSRNAELEALLNEVMATRDEAIRQNNELIAENSKLKADCNEWKDTANERLNAVQTLSAERNKVMAGVDELKNTLMDRTKDVQHLTEENDKLKTDLDQRNKDFWAMKKDRDELDSIGGKLRAENENLKAWYDEANKTASEAAEANDELKAKIAELRNRVGEQLAQIQDLNAEVHFHKEFGEGLDKQQKELQARYDELDSVNKEQAEKIRKLDKALTDLKNRNDDLQAENTNLTFLLEDAPEKETTKTLHVVLNDGTEIEFRRYTAYDYRTDINMFVVKDGEKYIAGFLRGDKPMNLAYWWTE